MMATRLEKELRLIRQRLDSIEDVLSEEMSSGDKKARAEALKEHREGKPSPSSGSTLVEGTRVDQGEAAPRQCDRGAEGKTRIEGLRAY